MDVKQGLVGLAPRRKAAGFTQETFAAALGVTRSLLAAWEVGRVWPSAEWLPKMAQLLSCSVAQLYEPPGENSIPQEGGEMPCRTIAEISTITQEPLPV